MQNLHLVRARGARWRVVDVRMYDACQLVTLSAVDPPDAGAQRRLLTPFDTLTPIDGVRRPRLVPRRRWRRACRALLAATTTPGGLRAAVGARIDLHPYQIEPALAVLRGLGCRLLLADDVGLGKTIQAGLVAAELLERGHIERLLVIAPAGLRDQWREELRERFTIDAVSAEAATLRRLAASLPIGMNPWTAVSAAVTSVDYVKRIDVLPAVAACRWDLLIVDEAHGVAGDSDRHAAIQALARRAAYVLLLTATPHNGDRRTFASLCQVGVLDDEPLLAFRRTRAEVRLGTPRKVRSLRITMRDAERTMHRLLAHYADAIRAELGRHERVWLALAVLHKRGFSSAASLALSLERRMSMLNGSSDGDRQLGLPLADPSGELVTLDEAPAWPADLGLRDEARERGLLDAAIAAARRASMTESKIAALDRLLRRSREPAVVFTEYRDTLQHVGRRLSRPFVTLHGGMNAAERSEALSAFAAKPHGILLATDAAAEGLNLHRHCRLVINLELPWNPMRLEQRIGRVDRIGQQRTVHAVHLIAADTGEERVLSKLRERISIARADIGAADPLDTEDAMAQWVIADDGR